MLIPVETAQFRRDLKRVRKRSKDLAKLKAVIQTLLEEDTLPAKNRDHALTGNWKGYRECHLEPDWLLIYGQDLDENILYLVRTGTHADLFDE